MAEKKPMSLNERNQFLLKGLSSQSKSAKPPPNPTPHDQPHKVKLQGRRRLCKLFSEEFDEQLEEEDPFADFDDGPNFNGITDFDSPSPAPPSPPQTKIRDILDDLSSKLDFLSIEKKKVVSDERQKPQNDDVPEFASADSSFDLSPLSRAQNDNTKSPSSEGNNFIQKLDEEENSVQRQKNIASVDKIDALSLVTQHYSSLSAEDDDSDDDACVVLTNANSIKQVHGQSCRVSAKQHVGAYISVDDSGNSSTSSDVISKDECSIVFTGERSTYKLPAKIAKMLYPHQREGLKWLWALHCRGTGGILGDDMGLGKTMQICSFLAGLFSSCLIKRVLVVAPKTLLSHWIKELSVVGLSEKTREYYGTSAKARQYELQYIFQYKGILLTTYDIVRNNSIALRGDSYFRNEKSEDAIIWDYIILDEGHIIKNPSTQRAKSLLEIPSVHRIIISGTPIQNNLKELWALFSFCCPELLGDKKEFKEKYESAILRGNEKNASDREKRIGSAVAKNLRERIGPYFLRRLKSEVFGDNEGTENAKLSKKNEMIVWLRLTSCQRQLYQGFLNSELAHQSFDGSPLAALTVLKKICDHPFLLTKRAAEDVLEGMETMLNQEDLGEVERMALHLADSNNNEDSQNKIDNVSCKICFILSLLGNLIPEGHKVLIFSQTRKMLNLVQEAIILEGYKFLRIDGTTKISDREKIVKDFQEGEGAPIFLLTSQVGGLGITLTKADRVIVVDPAWNPSTDNQSVDRAYRIGQKKDVIVYRLMTCGTIEEKIYKMQVFKGGLFRTATEQKEQTRYFSQKDLREIFRLPDQGFDVSLTQQQMHEEHDQQHIMDDSLKKHIEFLESQGIAGVSHHSLLFSKTAALPVGGENDEIFRRKENVYVGSSYSNSLHEKTVDGSEYALKPKDVNSWRKNTTPVSSSNRLTESAIRDRIERLRQTFANKDMILRLPDKGERIERQIAELNLELEMMKMAEKKEVEVIDLDDISGRLKNVHV